MKLRALYYRAAAAFTSGDNSQLRRQYICGSSMQIGHIRGCLIKLPGELSIRPRSRLSLTL